MIKVLGQIPYKKYKIGCHKCYSLLEYDKTDIIEDANKDSFLQVIFVTKYIKCPVCGTKLVISEKATPID